MEIYAQLSNLCAVFLSAGYENSEWCGVEWRVMREIIKKKKDEEIMFFRFDNTDVRGMLSIDGYSDVAGRNPEEIANLIIQRLGILNSESKESHTDNLENNPENDRSYTPHSLNIQQKLITPSNDYIFTKVLHDKLSLVFAKGEMKTAAQILLENIGDVSPQTAVNKLLSMEPLEAIRRWTEVVRDLCQYDYSGATKKQEIWMGFEAVHMLLLPRLVDISHIENYSDFDQDNLLFTVALPFKPPNRPIEVLCARMRRDHKVVLEPGDAGIGAVPAAALRLDDPALKSRDDPEVQDIIEQVGFELMRRLEVDGGIPERMGNEEWETLDSYLLAERYGLLNFYLVIPGENEYMHPKIFTELYNKLPNLPKFLLSKKGDKRPPLLCKHQDVDASIMAFSRIRTQFLIHENQ